jgi:NAD(P)H-hydrate epimerase
MKILTAAQMQRIDRLTTERYGVPSLTLMENAGRNVVDFLEAHLAPLASHRILILCGKGNNGGDGMVVARMLREQGLTPRVLLFADPEGLRGDAAINWARLRTSGLPEIVENLETWRAVVPSLSDTSLIIDALLGTGIAKPLEGFLLEVVRDVNSQFGYARVVAVDLPTGISADTGNLIGAYLRTDYSVTFTSPKIAHVFTPACDHLGEWRVTQIGTPGEALETDASLDLNLVERSGAVWIAAPRLAEANKGTYGHALIFAGSVGKTGAAAMASRAALRAGAGLVTAATAKSAQPLVAMANLEVMTVPLPEVEEGSISSRALEGPELDRLMEKKTVLAVGPGLGNHPDTGEFVRTVVNKYPLPLVLDADGLNAFAGRMDLFRRDLRPPGAAVFTPHPGEMARLTGNSIEEIQSNRIEIARGFAREYGVTLVLKGHRTLTALPDGQVYVNPTGNPGMAKGGTGDVLTGIVAGLLAQFSKHPVGEVVTAAVYLHGLAGDLAAEEFGQQSMLAGDLLENIPSAYKKLASAG